MTIIAHRGNDNIHRENSIEAILNSLNKSYIGGVEFDIRLTKDNIFVINHDPIYRGYIISNTNSRILKKLKLPTLEELLKQIDNKKILLIDVKVEKNTYILSKILNKILKKYNYNYYICSFNYKFIKKFKKKYKYRCGLIVGTIINKKHIDNSLDFYSISYKYKGSLPKKKIFYWTINKIENIKGNSIITDKPKKLYEYLKKV